MKNIITILFIGLSLGVYAQNTITGTVKDSNNTPIEGADIYVQAILKGTSTNEKGEFVLKNIPNTTLNITISFIGYETKNVTISSKNRTTPIQIILNDAVFKMDEVIVSTPYYKLQSENVMKVEKTSIKQLDNLGIITLADGISNLSGVSQVTTGVGIGKPVIRGLRGNRVLVYNQAVRLENQQFGEEHGLGINENTVDGVEAIKGPASLLYGSDALGGVLYFNPSKFAKTNTFDLSINQKVFSNTKGFSTGITAKKSFEHWKFLAQGARNEHSDYKTGSDKRVTNTRFNETVFNSAIGFSNSWVTSALRFDYNKSNVGIPEEIGLQTTTKKMALPYQDLTNKIVSLETNFFLNNSKITTTFGYTLNDRKEFEDEHEHGHAHHHEEGEHEDHDEHAHEGEDEDHDEHAHEEEMHPALFLKLKTISYDAKWHLPKFNNFQAIIGIQGMHQDNKNYGEEILIPNAITKDFGVFATGMLDLGDHSFQAGIRFDNRDLSTEKHVVMHGDEAHTFKAIDENFNNFSASFGYKTKLFDAITTRINLASGFKAPNLAELTSNGVHHGTNRFEIGNAKLNSERNFQTDIALEYSSKHFELFANGFYNHINNYIFIAPTGEYEEENEIFKYVQDNAKLYGGEFGLHLHPHPLDWLHLNSSFEFVIGKKNNGEYLPLIPANKLVNTLKVDFNFNKNIVNPFAFVTLESNFKQNNVSAFETKSKGYNLVHIGLGSNFNFNKTNVDLSLNINNLLDKEYVNHLSRLKNDGIQNIGRNIVISAKINL